MNATRSEERCFLDDGVGDIRCTVSTPVHRGSGHCKNPTRMEGVVTAVKSASCSVLNGIRGLTRRKLDGLWLKAGCRTSDQADRLKDLWYNTVALVIISIWEERLHQLST